MEALKREMEQRGYEILGLITKGWSSDKKFLMSDREGGRLVLRAAAIERCSSMTDLSGRFRCGMSATKTGRAAPASGCCRCNGRCTAARADRESAAGPVRGEENPAGKRRLYPRKIKAVFAAAGDSCWWDAVRQKEPAAQERAGLTAARQRRKAGATGA